MTPPKADSIAKAVDKMGIASIVGDLSNIGGVGNFEQDRVMEMQSLVDDTVMEGIPLLREIILDQEEKRSTRMAAVRLLAHSVGQYASRRREYVGRTADRIGSKVNIILDVHPEEKRIDDAEVLDEQ